MFVSRSRDKCVVIRADCRFSHQARINAAGRFFRIARKSYCTVYPRAAPSVCSRVVPNEVFILGMNWSKMSIRCWLRCYFDGSRIETCNYAYNVWTCVSGADNRARNVGHDNQANQHIILKNLKHESMASSSNGTAINTIKNCTPTNCKFRGIDHYFFSSKLLYIRYEIITELWCWLTFQQPYKRLVKNVILFSGAMKRRAF